MTATVAPGYVLVTGASGFISVWVVKTLLERGFTVRGTVRSNAKGNYLKNLFRDHDDRFSYVIVEDVAKDGAFDKALEGIIGVLHLASPVTFKATDPDAVIGPAVHGTLGILKSIRDHAPQVKRIVVTSSFASIAHGDLLDPAITFDEKDWNVDAPAEVEERGSATDGQTMYRASKTLAERAAWEFMRENKDAINFDLVTICPPLVFGPIIQEVASVGEINETMELFYRMTRISEPAIPENQYLTPGRAWVDVRDVALAHALALETPEAGGERFLAAGGSLVWQNFLDAIHGAGDFPDVPRVKPGAGKDIKTFAISTKKIENILGMKFRTVEEMAPDALRALRERGFR